jgi:hypothetical protein
MTFELNTLRPVKVAIPTEPSRSLRQRGVVQKRTQCNKVLVEQTFAQVFKKFLACEENSRRLTICSHLSQIYLQAVSGLGRTRLGYSDLSKKFLLTLLINSITN